MRIFNRIIAVLVLAGLFVLGLFAILHSLGVAGYQMSSLEQTLNLQGYYDGLRGFVSGVEDGNLTPAGIAILVVVAVVGLILLIFELKPRTPRRVRMQKGTYVTRGAVKQEVETAAKGTDNVFSSSARVKAKRRPGAVVNLNANIRRGEDQKQVRNGIRSSVQNRLARVGVPLSKVKVNVVEADPRQQSNARVR